MEYTGSVLLINRPVFTSWNILGWSLYWPVDVKMEHAESIISWTIDLLLQTRTHWSDLSPDEFTCYYGLKHTAPIQFKNMQKHNLYCDVVSLRSDSKPFIRLNCQRTLKETNHSCMPNNSVCLKSILSTFSKRYKRHLTHLALWGLIIFRDEKHLIIYRIFDLFWLATDGDSLKWVSFSMTLPNDSIVNWVKRH